MRFNDFRKQAKKCATLCLLLMCAVSMQFLKPPILRANEDIRLVEPKFYTVKLLLQGAEATGIIVGRLNDEYKVVTVAHAVQYSADGEEIVISTYDGAKHIAHVVSRHKDLDIATLVFRSSTQYETGTFSSSVTRGQPLVLTGFKAGENSLSSKECLLIAIGSSVFARPSGYKLAYRCNSALCMSGAPLTNERFQVVGIHGQADTYHDLLGGGVWKSGSALGIPASYLIRNSWESMEIVPQSSATSSSDDYYLSSTYKASLGHGMGALRDINKAIDNQGMSSIACLEHRVYLYLMLKMYSEAGSDISAIARANSGSLLPEWLIALLSYHASRDLESLLILEVVTKRLPIDSFRRVTGFYWLYAGAKDLGLHDKATTYMDLLCQASRNSYYVFEACD